MATHSSILAWNPMDGGAWWLQSTGLKESDTTERLHFHFQLIKNLSVMQETWIRSLFGNIPWKREGQPTPVLLPRESHG